MVTAIKGLRGQHRLRARVEQQLHDVLERRRSPATSAQVAFFDEDGPRGGVAIRCALTVRPRPGPVVRVEHTARTHHAAFGGALASLTRRLKRRVERKRRRQRRSPPRRPAAARRGSRRRAPARREGASESGT
jgi:hypothetical protein